MTVSAALELRARPRAEDERLKRESRAFAEEQVEHPIVVVCDFGREFARPERQFNVTRRDPWFFRAAEASDATQFSPDRFRVYLGLLHLFALARLDLALSKLAISPQPERLLLSSDAVIDSSQGAGVEVESLDPGDVWSEEGGAAIQRVRHQFIAGNAAALLGSCGYRLGPLLRRARRSAGS